MQSRQSVSIVFANIPALLRKLVWKIRDEPVAVMTSAQRVQIKAPDKTRFSCRRFIVNERTLQAAGCLVSSHYVHCVAALMHCHISCSI